MSGPPIGGSGNVVWDLIGGGLGSLTDVIGNQDTSGVLNFSGIQQLIGAAGSVNTFVLSALLLMRMNPRSRGDAPSSTSVLGESFPPTPTART